MDYSNLKKSSPKVFEILEKELVRQKETINLIPSENYASQAVLEALATPFTNKYSEGKSHARYYFGNTNIDEIEDYAKELALKLFDLSEKDWSVNVQPYSGSPANLAVYSALVPTGGKILAMALEHGGHLTHGHQASMTSTWWNFKHYGVTSDGLINYDEVERIAKDYKPDLIVCGTSAYSRIIDFDKFSKIARTTRTRLMADISHIAGLIVGKAHPSPFPGADVVTTTTHKTLRGPRGAIIISNKEVSDAIDKAVFPGLQGGPHENTIASMAVAFEEALNADFKDYAQQIVKNAKVCAEKLGNFGFKIISGGTENHLLLVDLTEFGLSGKEAGELLERANIIVNKNAIPNDPRKPWDPSGIRIGTPAVTTQGMKEQEIKKIAEFIKRILIDKEDPSKVKTEVLVLMSGFKF